MQVPRFAIALAISLAFVGCNQPSMPDPTQNATSPSVKINLSDGQLVKGSVAHFQIDLQSPQDGDVQLSLTTPSNVTLNQQTFDIKLKANQHQLVNVEASFKRAGYFSITALANSNSWKVPESSMLSFGVAPTVSTVRDTSAKATPSGIEDLETHLKTLPIDADGTLQTQQIIYPHLPRRGHRRGGAPLRLRRRQDATVSLGRSPALRVAALAQQRRT